MDLFQVHLNGFINETLKKKNRIKLTFFKTEIQNGVRKPNPSPYIIVDRVSKSSAILVKNYLDSIGCKSIIEESDYALMDEQEQVVINFFQKLNAPVICPRCSSNQISTGQRGFSIVTGFIGSNKTINRCAKCGYSWKP